MGINLGTSPVIVQILGSGRRRESARRANLRISRSQEVGTSQNLDRSQRRQRPRRGPRAAGPRELGGRWARKRRPPHLQPLRKAGAEVQAARRTRRRIATKRSELVAAVALAPAKPRTKRRNRRRRSKAKLWLRRRRG